MCGLAALLAAAPRALEAIVPMCDAQAHRGPDGEGYALLDGALMRARKRDQAMHGTLALGHRRLAIIDLDTRAAQPMASACGRYQLVYNGELYNYRELRDELIAAGRRFRTESDSEVLIEAWAHWGEGALDRCNGMWAFALADLERRELVLCRDRFGIKPLHLATADGLLAVASEIKGLLAAPGIRAAPELDVLADHLVNAAADRDDRTAFAGIRALPAGHLARVSFDAPERVEPRRWWSLDAAVAAIDGRSMDYGTAVDAVAASFERAIGWQLRSDVPVGSCLSGGVDSSAIAGVAARRLGGGAAMLGFTAGSEEPALDERDWARRVAEHAGLTHALTVPTRAGFVAALDALAWHQEAPLASTSLYAQYAVMRLARERAVPVLLDGQGADELFCGYKKYYPVHLAALWRGGQRRAAARELSAYLRHGDRGALRLADARRYLARLPIPSQRARWRLLAPSRRRLAARPPAPLLGRDVASMQRLDLERNSVPTLLRIEDRNAMAHGIESRVPFLDHELAALALALPPAYKLAGGRTKRVLRDAVRPAVPALVLARRDKYNFFAPLSRWLDGGDGALAERFADEIRASRLLPELIDVPGLLRARARPGTAFDDLYFRAATLGVWERRFLA